MQITVDISEDLIARAAELGLTPEAYIRDLFSREQSAESLWQREAERRAGEIDKSRTKLVSWEEIELRLRSRIAG